VFVKLDSTNQVVLVAAYGTGAVSSYPLGTDGRVQSASAVVPGSGSGPKRDRQASPHAHFVTNDPSNQFALAVDLGADKVFSYQLNAQAKTISNKNVAFSSRPGAGPRHLAFHPNKKFAYLINELDNTLVALSYDGNGKFTEVHTVSTLPQGWSGENTAGAVKVSPDGNFVYGSNRGHNSLAIFRIDQATGRITLFDTPIVGLSRDFGIDPSGNVIVVASQYDNSIASWRIDRASGKIRRIGKKADVKSPICVKIIDTDAPITPQSN